MRLFLTIASILLLLGGVGFLYMASETEKYWQEKTNKPPGQKG